MKNSICFLFFLSTLCFSQNITAQDVAIRKEIQYIDSVMNRNPYFDKNLSIIYYHSLDITADKELVIKMDFKGPFICTSIVKLADLEFPFTVDTSEYSSSIIWRCKQLTPDRTTRCVKQEHAFTGGERDTIDSDEISIMLPSETRLRLGLIKSIDELIKKVLE
jgi:hypothetical protein